MLRLFYTAFGFGIIGILSGLYYRELTKAHDFTDRSASQLGLVHSHFLVLGFVILLLVLALEKLFSISAAAPKLYTWFFWTWSAGVAITGGMMMVKGSLVVMGADASSAALDGIAGLGHISLTAGFVLLFLAVRKALVSGTGVAPRTA